MVHTMARKCLRRVRAGRISGMAVCIATVCSACDTASTGQLLAQAESQARSPDGRYIAWREHLIDDEALGQIELRGSDGLIMADLDRDGFDDIVSVHESDVEYDGVADGFIRIAFGSADPDVWELVTLAQGPEAGAAEDVAAADINGDGYLDLVAACELSHLIYFENPGADIRAGNWPRLIPSISTDRGSFIRVFLADLNGDGLPEVIAANKGAQDPTQARQEPKEISFFETGPEPLDDASWVEHVLTRVPWPINSRPVDIDADGDIDVLGGSVAEGRMMLFENVGTGGAFEFVEHAVNVQSPRSELLVNGFNMDFVDFNADGRLDVLTFDTAQLIGINLVWLEQPHNFDESWVLHTIGDIEPDAIVGLVAADINDDGHTDVMIGGYSLGSRTEDGNKRLEESMGRLAWFENPGSGADRWRRYDISRRERGMFDKFIPVDMDNDGDTDFASTRGNSGEYDGVFWLEQTRHDAPVPAFARARANDSPEAPLP